MFASDAQQLEMPLAARVLVIGHRGAPASRPEHTLASYGKAIADGADFIEPDLVMTQDGVMVARHENEISGTTDVAEHAQFAGRKTIKVIDGDEISGWFSEDFTLAELKTLRARERLPQLRSTRHDGQFQIVTLDEIIDFVAVQSRAVGHSVGIIPEIKHSTYFQSLGLAMEDTLIATITQHLYARTAPLEIQSFEVGNLQYLREKLGNTWPNIRLLQLLGAPYQQPYDVVVAGGDLSYGKMMSANGLHAMARYADAIGPDCRAIIPWLADGTLGQATSLVRDAHAAGLEVHPYTFRPENQFLPRAFWLGDDPRTLNEAGMIRQLQACLDAGIDAFFTDAPAIGRKAFAARTRDPS